MTLRLVLSGLSRGKARFACAVAGVAIAVGSLVFVTSLVATNRAQAPAAARRACAPWAGWRLDGVQLRMRGGGGGRGGMKPPKGMRPPTEAPRGAAPKADLELPVVQTTIDYRPGGHVLQGPPMMALIAPAAAEPPYAAVKLTEGRWVNAQTSACEVVAVKRSLMRFGAPAPKLGEVLRFVGEKGTMSATVVGYMEGAQLPREFPYVLANAPAFAALENETKGCARFYRELPRTGEVLSPRSEQVIQSFTGDEQKRMDYATPLLILAAILTALSLLVNSLLLSVEANRKALATLRTLGLTRLGVVRFVSIEALLSAAVGWGVGVLGALAALFVYVACDPTTFPTGMAVDSHRIGLTLIILPFILILAVLFALRPALKVRPMDASAQQPKSRRFGMAVTFALGFSAFVAVEVWGASLMRAFVPSPEWPDAIVSILPGGASSFDIEKLRTIPGVRRISELVPRQCMLAGKAPANALFLAAEWLPQFRFTQGSWETAEAELRTNDAVVITEMLANAHGLKMGDRLAVEVRKGRGATEEVSFPIVGVVDLNWHMVTSRALVRAMYGMPKSCDGAVFCSFDTMGAIDPRTYFVMPGMSAPMTHLWLDYEPDFLARHGVFPAGRLVEAEIARRLGHPERATVRLHARDEIADGTLAHGSDVIGQAARVPFVFLAILAIGFVALLVAEADARRNELVLLRAVGATRGQIAARLSSTALKTAVWGMVVGLPVGSLVGWLFTFQMKIWPGLPHWFVLPVRVVSEGAAGAVIFALVIAVPTALVIVGRSFRRK